MDNPSPSHPSFFLRSASVSMVDLNDNTDMVLDQVALGHVETVLENLKVGIR